MENALGRNLADRGQWRQGRLYDPELDGKSDRGLSALVLEPMEHEGAEPDPRPRLRYLGGVWGYPKALFMQVAAGITDIIAAMAVRESEWMTLVESLNSFVENHNFNVLVKVIANGITAMSTLVGCPIEDVVSARLKITWLNYGGSHSRPGAPAGAPGFPSIDQQVDETMDKWVDEKLAGEPSSVWATDNHLGELNADRVRVLRMLSACALGNLHSRRRDEDDVAYKDPIVALGDIFRLARHPGVFTVRRPQRISGTNMLMSLAGNLARGKIDGVMLKEFNRSIQWEQRPAKVFVVAVGRPTLVQKATTTISRALPLGMVEIISHQDPKARSCWVTLLIPLTREEVAQGPFPQLVRYLDWLAQQPSKEVESDVNTNRTSRQPVTKDGVRPGV